MKIKLLQWNIWYKENIANIVSEIKKMDPDVICLQEVTVNHPTYNKIDCVKFLQKELGMKGYYKYSEKIKGGEGASFGNMILSKYPIKKKKFAYVQKRKGKLGADYADENRIYLEINLSVGKKTLQVGTTHLSYTHKFLETEKKRKEAGELLKIVGKKKKNFIFSGDLNSLPDSSSLVQRLEGKLKNAEEDLSKKTWTTKPFDYNGFKVDKLKYKLDYCYVTKDLNVLSAKVAKTKYSDHLPILCEFDV